MRSSANHHGDRPADPDGLSSLGLPWPIGTSTTVKWISEGTVADGTIATAIPPLFPAYATILEPDYDAVGDRDHERAVVDALATRGTTQWWLGYLDTGAHDVVFPQADRVLLYWGWSYVLIQAGPEQAFSWRGSLPDLIFPLDRSWLFSMLWDDGWTCVGGPTTLIDALVADPSITHAWFGAVRTPLHPVTSRADLAQESRS